MPQGPKLLDQVCAAVRVRHYSIRTEKAYVSWIRRFIRLMASLLYGSGLRLMECLRIRGKDLDCANHLIVVRDGKGDKDRVTPDSAWIDCSGSLLRGGVPATKGVRMSDARVRVHDAPPER